MKLYVYCLAEGIDTLDQPPLGISGTEVRVLKVNDLSALVSDLDAESVPVTRENALAHAAVVRSILDYATPLPFRFGTVVTEQQLRSYVLARQPALETKLADLRGCIEMSVKIIWENIHSEPHISSPDHTRGPGASFLEEKRREILGNVRNAAQATEISTWLHEQVSGLIRDEQVTLRPTEKLVLSAAHLVERVKISQYRENWQKRDRIGPNCIFF